MKKGGQQKKGKATGFTESLGRDQNVKKAHILLVNIIIAFMLYKQKINSNTETSATFYMYC